MEHNIFKQIISIREGSYFIYKITLINIWWSDWLEELVCPRIDRKDNKINEILTS